MTAPSLYLFTTGRRRNKNNSIITWNIAKSRKEDRVVALRVPFPLQTATNKEPVPRSGLLTTQEEPKRERAKKNANTTID